MTTLEWLLSGDPAIRWQVLRDLVGEPEATISVERARVATDGFGAELLARQLPNGGWRDVPNPRRLAETPDGSAMHALQLLKAMGVDPDDDPVRRAVALVKENVTHYEGGRPFFDGEVEPCINGRVLGIGAYFGEPNERLPERLLSEQLDDGGWNCDAPRSSRSSFHTTICVVEGLSEFELAHGPDAAIAASQAKAQEYLLERHMFRSLSTGAAIDDGWALFSFPVGWHYDVLRGLEYLRHARTGPDPRIVEAIAIVERNRSHDGRWPLQHPHRDGFDFDLGERVNEPSRWNTLRALRVLDWARHP